MLSQVDTGAASERKGRGDFAKALRDFANFWAIMQADVLAAFLRRKEDAFATKLRGRCRADWCLCLAGL